jgi:carbon monoxide dehydrogenase subunit G
VETKIESKIGNINGSSERVYSFLSNFNNFKHLIPPDKVKEWQSTEDSCHFKVEGIGETGLRIIEKEPFSTIKITGEEGSKFDFHFWIQLKEPAPYDTKIKLTIKADLNPMLKMMASKPLQNFVDTLVDQLEKLPFQ